MDQKYCLNVLTVQELGNAGVTPSQVRTRHQTGSLVRLAQGIYAERSFLDSLTPYERPYAHLVALAKASPSLTLSHASAAMCWGAPLMDYPRQVQFSTAHSGGSRNPRMKIYRRRPTTCHSATFRYGLRVASPQQTLVDCAVSLPLIEAVNVANFLVGRDLVTFDEAQRLLSLPRRYYQARARLVASRLSPACESPLETIVWNLVNGWNLELPEQQVWFRGHDGARYRVDFLWRDARLIVEADGEVKYSGAYGDPVQLIRAERQRQRHLESQGWRVIRVSWEDATRRPLELYDRLRSCGVAEVGAVLAAP